MFRPRPDPAESGVALPIAIFALVVIGALVAGIFFTARIELRSGETAMSGARAAEAAQAGLQVGVAKVLTLGATLTDGQTATGIKTQLGATASYYQLGVTRLNRHIYLLRSAGTYEVGSTVAGSRTMAMLVKRYLPEVNADAALIVIGTPSVGGAAAVDGHDQTPASWTDCDPPGGAQPGIRTDVESGPIAEGSVDPVPSYSDSAVTKLGSALEFLFAQLAGQADHRLVLGGTINGDPSPNSSAGTCLRSSPTNWGDPVRSSPAHVCESYFPIIHLDPPRIGGALPTVKLQAVGQGVLLINANLELEAGSNFHGLILIRGRLGSSSGPVTISGAVVALNVEDAPTGADLSGEVTIVYSRCAQRMALRDRWVTAPAPRGFVQF